MFPFYKLHAGKRWLENNLQIAISIKISLSCLQRRADWTRGSFFTNYKGQTKFYERTIREENEFFEQFEIAKMQHRKANSALLLNFFSFLYLFFFSTVLFARSMEYMQR